MTNNNSIICKNCNNDFEGEFCHRCGRPAQVKRIDKTYISSEISHVLNLDKGILYTIREMIFRPGESIKTYIKKDRTRLVRPIIFLILCSLTYSVFEGVFGFEDRYVNHSFEEESASNAIFAWITNNYGYSNVLMAIFIAMWLRLVFRKQDYNYFEILVMLCYAMGMGMLIFALLGCIQSLTHLQVFDKGLFIAILFICWIIGQLFEGNKWINILKGFLSYMLGMLTFSLLATLIGFILDSI